MNGGQHPSLPTPGATIPSINYLSPSRVTLDTALHREKGGNGTLHPPVRAYSYPSTVYDGYAHRRKRSLTAELALENNNTKPERDYEKGILFFYATTHFSVPRAVAAVDMWPARR